MSKRWARGWGLHVDNNALTMRKRLLSPFYSDSHSWFLLSHFPRRSPLSYNALTSFCKSRCLFIFLPNFPCRSLRLMH